MSVQSTRLGFQARTEWKRILSRIFSLERAFFFSVFALALKRKPRAKLKLEERPNQPYSLTIHETTLASRVRSGNPSGDAATAAQPRPRTLWTLLDDIVRNMEYKLKFFIGDIFEICKIVFNVEN